MNERLTAITDPLHRVKDYSHHQRQLFEFLPKVAGDQVHRANSNHIPSTNSSTIAEQLDVGSSAKEASGLCGPSH